MLKEIIKDISRDYIVEAQNSPYLLEDMAAMEKYMAESYNGRIFVELLQNADDSGSSRVLVEEYQGNIIFANNGRPFDASDIVSISRSGASKKDRGSNIGYRGVGFKSTSYLTNEIIIFSANTYFTFSKSISASTLNRPVDKIPTIRIPFIIEDLEARLKERVNGLISDNYTTIFIFKDAKLNQFKEEIQDLNNGYFIFLNNVKDCEIKMAEQTYNFKRVLEKFADYTKVKFMSHIESDWLVVDSEYAGIAMKYLDNKVVPCDPGEAIYHCYLPTLDKTPFLLKINADFSTDPSRKHITQDELTDKALGSIALLLFEMLNTTLSTRDATLAELINIISMVSSFSAINKKLVDKLNSLIEESLYLELPNNSIQRVNECKLIPNDFEDSEKNILRQSKYIESKLIKSDYYKSFPMIDKFIEKYSNEFLEAEDILEALREKSFVGRLNPYTYAKILSFVARALKTGSITNKKSLSLHEILIPSESGPVKLEDLSDLIRPTDEIRGAISETISSYDMKFLSEKLGISKESVTVPPMESLDLQQKYIEEASELIPISKPVIAKWRSAEQQCIELEKHFGNSAVDVSKRNVGYDIESTTPNGDKRYIEVKLLNSASSPFTITNNEYTAAHQYAENYFICLLIHSDHESRVLYVGNPLKNLKFEKRVRQWEWYCEHYSGEEFRVELR